MGRRLKLIDYSPSFVGIENFVKAIKENKGLVFLLQEQKSDFRPQLRRRRDPERF